jgi:hypothetical protein
MTSIARELISASNLEIEAAFEKLGYSVSADPEYGLDISFGPASEIDEFRKNHSGWSDPGHLVTNTPDALEIIGARASRGQRKREVVLIRFGQYCAIYGMDQ